MLKELEAATEMFADENVIGEGGYGIVYHGVLEDGTQVGVKNLLNNSNLTLSSRMESVVNIEISVIICELRWLWISWENPHRFEVEFVGVSN
ncbi:putative serine/threonine-protein kinase [Hordeum vulgare]|nr:putative serine/threonine-protein kinase [Hordeum vulgare]